MIDLDTLDTTTSANKGARMTVMHPITRKPVVDDEGREAYLILAGADSDRAAEVDRQQTERRVERRSLIITGAEINEERLEKLVGCTVEVVNMALNGRPIDVARPSSVRAMYDRLKWLRDDAERFIMDRGNFLPTASSSSVVTLNTNSAAGESSAEAPPSPITSPSPNGIAAA